MLHFYLKNPPKSYQDLVRILLSGSFIGLVTYKTVPVAGPFPKPCLGWILIRSRTIFKGVHVQWIHWFHICPCKSVFFFQFFQKTRFFFPPFQPVNFVKYKDNLLISGQCNVCPQNWLFLIKYKILQCDHCHPDIVNDIGH